MERRDRRDLLQRMRNNNRRLLRRILHIQGNRLFRNRIRHVIGSDSPRFVNRN